MYNDTYFNKQPTSQCASKDVVSCQLDELALQSNTTPKLPSVTDIFKEFKTNMTNIAPIEGILHENNECKHADIVASQSKLCFIKYTTENTLRRCWYLVQIYLEVSLDILTTVYSSLITQMMQTRVTNLVDFGQNGISTHVVLQTNGIM